eukprot:10931356-Karenia_brevis.AAC.1
MCIRDRPRPSPRPSGPMCEALPSDADFIPFTELAEMSPQAIRLLQRPEAPVRRGEALRWLASMRPSSRSAASAGSGEWEEERVRLRQTDPSALEAAMAAAE